MDQKIRNIVALVFVVLLALTFLPWLYRLLQGADTGSEKKTSVTLSGFAPGTVGKIVIAKDGGEVTLAFRDGKWYAGEAEADTSKIEGLFRDFAELRVKDMVAETEESHKKFGVEKEAPLRLTIEKDGKSNVFYVGKIGPAVNEFYLRKDGIKNVYLVSGLLRTTLNTEAKQWEKTEEGVTPPAE